MSRPVIPIDSGGGRGGVAACMNWTAGPALVPRPPPRNDPHQTTGYVRDLCERTSRALVHEPPRAAERPYSHRHACHGVTSDVPGDDEVIVTGRYTRRSPVPPVRLEAPSRNDYEGRRPPTPVRDTQRSTRKEAWQDPRPHPPRTYIDDRTPFQATKAYLEKYVNRSLGDREIQEIVHDMRADLNRAADEECVRQRLLSMKRPPEKYLDKPYKSMLRYDDNQPKTWDGYDESHRRGFQTWDNKGGYEARDLYAPRAPNAPNPYNYRDYQQRRPATAHPRAQKQVSWDVTPRTVSSYPQGTYIDKSHGKHLSSWRRDRWNPDGVDYDDLLRRVAKYETMRHENQTSHDVRNTRYNARYHGNTRSGKLTEKVVDDQGKVNVQLDCPKDSDLNVNVRVQSRSDSRYN